MPQKGLNPPPRKAAEERMMGLGEGKTTFLKSFFSLPQVQKILF